MMFPYHTNQLCIQIATFQASSGRVTATAAAGSRGLPTPARAAAGRVARWSRGFGDVDPSGFDGFFLGENGDVYTR